MAQRNNKVYLNDGFFYHSIISIMPLRPLELDIPGLNPRVSVSATTQQSEDGQKEHVIITVGFSYHAQQHIGNQEEAASLLPVAMRQAVEHIRQQLHARPNNRARMVCDVDGYEPVHIMHLAEDTTDWRNVSGEDLWDTFDVCIHVTFAQVYLADTHKMIARF